MICNRCGREREVLFNRPGGVVSPERALLAGRRITQDHNLTPRRHICLDCIESKMASEGWWRADIITNPTVIPPDDPVNWVIADDL